MSLVTTRPGGLTALACPSWGTDSAMNGGSPAATASTDGIVSSSRAANAATAN
jgi:hypothetical protein